MFFKDLKKSSPKSRFFTPAVFFLSFGFAQLAYSVDSVEFDQDKWNEIEDSSLIHPSSLSLIKTSLQKGDGLANVGVVFKSDLDTNGLAKQNLSIKENLNGLTSYVDKVISDSWYFHDGNQDIDLMHKFKLLPLVEVMVNFDGLYSLVNSDLTHLIEVNYEGEFDTLQALEDISAPIPRATFDGSGVAIAITDSGIDLTHQDLGGDGVSDCADVVYSNSKVIGGFNAIPELGMGSNDDTVDPLLANDLDDPCPYATDIGILSLSDSPLEHGTALAAVAAGNVPVSGNVGGNVDGNFGGYVGGVAPGAKLFGILVNRLTDIDGVRVGHVPNSFNVMRGIEYVINHGADFPDNPIKVVSTSISFRAGEGGIPEDEIDSICLERLGSFSNASQMLVNSGIAHVTSSGNNSENARVNFPGCLPSTISVSSVRNGTLERLSTSNVGQVLDLFAPNDAHLPVLDHGYDTVGGTSVAAPIVSGAIAVLQNAAKVHFGEFLTVAEVLNYLTENGDDVIVDRGALSTIVRPRINLQASVDAIIRDAANLNLLGGQNNPAESCQAILTERPNAADDVYWLNSRSGSKAFEAYCDMTTDGGGWTLVVAQFDANQVTDWNEGIQPDYDPTLASRAGFALNLDELPAHSQVAFGRDLLPTDIDYVNFEYTTGDIPLTELTGLKTGNTYYAHRDQTDFYRQHDATPSANTVANTVLNNTLTFDAEPGIYSWAFSPNNPNVNVRGFAYNGSRLLSSAEDFAWTVWVRGSAPELGDSPSNSAASCSAILAERPSVESGIYWLNSRSGNKTFEAYCDMTTDGGGWTLVVAQFDTNPVTNWNEGIQSDYDPRLVSRAGFALNSDELPAHSQVAFGRDLSPTDIDYADAEYTTGNIPLTQLTGLKTGNTYFLHRDQNAFYSQHNPAPARNVAQNAGFNNTLTFDVEPDLYSWAFSPNHPNANIRGFAYDRSRLLTTAEDFAWTVWVRSDN